MGICAFQHNVTKALLCGRKLCNFIAEPVRKGDEHKNRTILAEAIDGFLIIMLLNIAWINKSVIYFEYENLHKTACA